MIILKVVGFIGASGTGKSHRATWVAKERNIDFLIDDGILIKGSRIIAGASAKKESTKIASVKRALFLDVDQCYEVKRAIEIYNPESILILGTSDGMIESIAKKLGFPEVSEKIYIHEVATEYEIKQATTMRKEQGKHVIPVPTLELKKDFSGFFLDPLQIFRKKGPNSYQLVGEKSVVRPTFSYLGKYTISDYTLYQILEYTILKIPGFNKVSRFRVENHTDGVLIDIDVVLIYGYTIKPLLKDAQNKVVNEIEKLTALNVKAFDITAKSLVVESKP